MRGRVLASVSTDYGQTPIIPHSTCRIAVGPRR